MATGVTRDYSKRHTKGGDAAQSDFANNDPLPLPDEAAWPTIGYSAKATRQQILSLPPQTYFDGLSATPTEIARFKPDTLIFGDNSFALLKLLETHAGKVSLVYVDPPFCTGLDFHSRDMAHAYKDTLSPSAYVEFMRRRFILMRELLAPEGSLYVHIGHQMLFHLKVVLDEVFGPSNFRNLIVRRKCSSKNYTTKQLPNLHDYILFYTKSKSYIWNPPSTKADDSWIDREYTKSDAKGRYKLVPVHAPGLRNGETGQPWKGKLPPPGKHWQLTPDKLDKLDDAGEIHWSRNGNPRRKVRLSEDKRIPLSDYWDGFKDAHHQSTPITGYPTEKNLSLLRTIVESSSNPGDIVCDAFSGSGTTVHAAALSQRRWFGIDSSGTAIATMIKRFRNGLAPMGDFVEKTQRQMMFDALASNAGSRHTSIPFNLAVSEPFYGQFRKELRRLLDPK